MERKYEARDPAFERRVRDSYARQPAMALIGAVMTRVEPGLVEIELPFRADLCQQNGYIHAGITSAIADSAGGYAGFSLMPAGSDVLTVEFKINLLAPAGGDRLVATGRVVKPGRSLFICEISVDAIRDGEITPCAHGLQTLMCILPRSDLS
jgi:uncharacterized protein (TIGR00369 family)